MSEAIRAAVCDAAQRVADQEIANGAVDVVAELLKEPEDTPTSRYQRQMTRAAEAAGLTVEQLTETLERIASRCEENQLVNSSETERLCSVLDSARETVKLFKGDAAKIDKAFDDVRDYLVPLSEEELSAVWGRFERNVAKINLDLLDNSRMIENGGFLPLLKGT
jgi:hypothetical protein